MALGAFGLESEIDKKAFIRKVLEEGTTDPASLANRLTDKSLDKLAAAFGFGDAGGARTGEAGFAAKIVAAYKTRAFEAAVGEADNNMRLAMNFRREIAELAKGAEGGSWFAVLGSKPLREVFEKAFGLPSQFGQIDIDQQREVLRDKTSADVRQRHAHGLPGPRGGREADRPLPRPRPDRAGRDRHQPRLGGADAAAGDERSSGSSGLWNLLASRS